MALHPEVSQFLQSMLARLSPPNQRLSLFQDKRWLYLVSYSASTIIPKSALRMGLIGVEMAKVEVYFPYSQSWCAIKEGNEIVRLRERLLVNGATFHLLLAVLSAWRNFRLEGEYLPSAPFSAEGRASYYRIDRGILAEDKVNAQLPADLKPAYVIGLKEGAARDFSKYPLSVAREARLHIYHSSALPAFSPQGQPEQGDRFGLGIPIFHAESNLAVAEFLPQAIVPSLYLLHDLENFARKTRNEMLETVLKNTVFILSFLRGGRNAGRYRDQMLGYVLSKDLETLGASDSGLGIAFHGANSKGINGLVNSPDILARLAQQGLL